jgi:CelD/BcsL family acetyltransferase involved in cellulose biosynthesis
MTDQSEVYEIDPIEDPRWGKLVLRHPLASVFHSPQWLSALRKTYGFRPVALSTTPIGRELENGFVFCHVDSWLTGNRFVSLPFSDHCDVLADDAATIDALLSAAVARSKAARRLYVELRPAQSFPINGRFPCSSTSYYLHKLDLRPSLETIFSNCHKDSTQRKIRRAERELLDCEEGRSDRSLNDFYRLLLLTRRRHRLPPQPASWFRNLVANFGASLKIRVAYKAGRPIAAIVTLRHNGVVVYKYGCSDSRFHNLGSMQILFWRAIEDAKRGDLTTLDLGRSDLDTPGLIQFKDRWGAERSTIVYRRLQAPGSARLHPFGGGSRKQSMLRGFVSRLPDPALRCVGSLFYKHVG